MKLLAFILLIHCTYTLSAQLGGYVYGGQGTDFIFDITASPDGNFYAVGSKTDINRRIWLLKLSPDGTLIWEKTIVPLDPDFHENGYSIHVLEGGSLLITGEQTEIGSFERKSGLVLKTDENGNKIWEKKFTDASAFYDASWDVSSIYIVGWHDNTGSTDSGIFKVLNEDGEIKFSKTIDVYNQTRWHNILPAGDGNFIITGRTNVIGVGFRGICLKKITKEGNIIWSSNHNTGFDLNGTHNEDVYVQKLDVVQTMDGTLWVADADTNDENLGVYSFTANGTFVSEKIFSEENVTHLPHSILSLADHKLIIAGSTEEDAAFVYLITEQGQVLWKYYFQETNKHASILTAVVWEDHLLAGGEIIEDLTLPENMQGWIKAIPLNGLLPFVVKGEVWLDQDNNCEVSGYDILLKEKWLTVESNGHESYLVTDANGYFEYYTDENHNLFQLLNPDPEIWTICQEQKSVYSGPHTPDTLIVFLLQQPDPCPLLEVGLTQPDFVRCDTSCLTATITNLGVSISDPVILSIKNDLVLDLISASSPFTATPEGFEFSLLPINGLAAERIDLCYKLNCDVQPAATHQIHASISSASCKEIYTGPYYTVNVICEGELVTFELQNIGGGGPSASTYYSLFIDDRKVLDQEWIGLAEGDLPRKLSFTANGRTWRLELQQAAKAPGMDRPTASIEDCGKQVTSLHSIGYLNAFRQNSLDRNIDVIQGANISGERNRIIEAYGGLGTYNLISDLFPMEYTAKVINPFDEVVTHVDFELSFSPNFELPTFRILSSSYPADFHLLDDHSIRISMDDIELNKGENGMVKFSIQPFASTPADSGELSLLRIDGKVFVNAHDPILLSTGFQNYTLQSLDLSRPYYDYGPEFLIYDGKYTDFGTGISANDNGKVFFGGTSTSYSNRGRYDAFIVKSDYDGHAEWLRALDLGDQGSNSLRGLLATENGSCIYTATYVKPDQDTYVDHAYVEFGGLSPDGLRTFTHVLRPFNESAGAAPQGIFKTTDQNVVIFGVTLNSTNGLQPFYFKIDQAGNMIWSKTNNNPTDFWPYGGCASSDGGFYLIGEIYLTGSSYQLEKFDANGTLIWTKEIQSEYYGYFDDMVENEQGEILLIGTGQWMDDSLGYVIGLDVMKYNSSGNKVWERNQVVGEWGNIQIRDVCASQNGFLATGMIFADTMNQFWDVLILEIDQEGNILWYKNYGNQNTETGYAICNPDPNTILVHGNNQEFPLLYSLQSFLLKTDESGLTATKEIVANSSKSETWLFPNPVHDEFKIIFDPAPSQSIWWTISNVTGRVLMQGHEYTEENLRVLISDLPPGIFYISFPLTNYPGKTFVVVD